MPLDRTIEVQVEIPGDYNDRGVYVPGAVSYLRLWATKTDRDLVNVIETGGERGEIMRTWRLRWNAAVYAAGPTLLTVVDDGVKFGVQNMVEVTGRQGEYRRRWIDLTGVYSK